MRKELNALRTERDQLLKALSSARTDVHTLKEVGASLFVIIYLAIKIFILERRFIYRWVGVIDTLIDSLLRPPSGF